MNGESSSKITKSLQEANARFQTLVDLIPASLYTHKPQHELQNGAKSNSKKQAKSAKATDAKTKSALKNQPQAPATAEKPATASTSQSLSRQELQEKLHAKIATFASERNAVAPTEEGVDSAAPSPGGKQALIAQAQAEKKAQAEARKKAKREERKLQQKALQKALKDVETDKEASEREQEPRLNKGKGKEKMDVDQDEPSSWVDEDQSMALVQTQEKEDAVDFSHLDFADPSMLRPVDTLPGKGRPNGGRKPGVSVEQAALDRIEDRRKFLEKLTPQARERAEEKDRWQKAENRAAGGKVLDEEKRLKKMARRKDKAKEVSRKEWAGREKQITEQQAAKQKERNNNIQMRIQAKKDRKNGVKPKKKTGDKKSLSHSSKKSTGRKTNERGFELSLKAKKAKAQAGKPKSGGGKK